MSSNIPWMFKSLEPLNNVNKQWNDMVPFSTKVEPWEPISELQMNPPKIQPNKTFGSLQRDAHDNPYQYSMDKPLQTNVFDYGNHCMDLIQNANKYMPQSNNNLEARKPSVIPEKLNLENKTESSQFSMTSNCMPQNPFLSNLISYLSFDRTLSVDRTQNFDRTPGFDRAPGTNSWANGLTSAGSSNESSPHESYNSFCNELKNKRYEEKHYASSSSPKEHTDLVSLMEELGNMNMNDASNASFQSLFSSVASPTLCTTSSSKGCVFCKNNGYHSTFYKTHVLKDESGHCSCPVLRAYVCPLCGVSGDLAHTLKYCPKNTITRGDPVSAGLPPGKVTNWREVATKLARPRRM